HAARFALRLGANREAGIPRADAAIFPSRRPSRLFWASLYRPPGAPPMSVVAGRRAVTRPIARTASAVDLHMTRAVRRFPRRDVVIGSSMNQTVEQPSQSSQASAFPPVPQQQEIPLAVVRGQPVLEIPQDLYIPPD